MTWGKAIAVAVVAIPLFLLLEACAAGDSELVNYIGGGVVLVALALAVLGEIAEDEERPREQTREFRRIAAVVALWGGAVLVAGVSSHDETASFLIAFLVPAITVGVIGLRFRCERRSRDSAKVQACPVCGGKRSR
jgi:hypothetical protein